MAHEKGKPGPPQPKANDGQESRRKLNGQEADEALFWRIGGGDPAATRILVDRKVRRLLGLASRLLGDRAEAEDVVQEIFLRPWRQAPNWRTGEATLDTWLYRVAFNLCTDRLRKRRETHVAAVPDRVDPAPGPDHGIAEREQQRQVAEGLTDLPQRQREAIVLQYYEGLSNSDAASIMGINVEAFESLLARARRNLRKSFGRKAAAKGA